MLEGSLDGHSLVRRTRLSAFDVPSVGSGIDRQAVEFLAVSDPARFPCEPELLLHPFLDFKVSGKGAHGARLSPGILRNPSKTPWKPVSQGSRLQRQ